MQKRQPKERLGELLIEAGHLQRRELEKALEIQRVAGGHLGTNLLEMGVVTEEVLLEAVGRLHENPTVPAHRLREIPKEVSSKVPRDLVRRHNIVPFALHGNTVYIASQRPGDIHIENEVTLATSRLTRTFIGLEVRVQEALHRHHGHSLPLRFSRLAAKLDDPGSGQTSPTPSLRSNEPDSNPAVGGPGFVLEPATPTTASEWVSGSLSPTASPDKETAIAASEISSARPGILDSLEPELPDGFDPTLSNTVGRKIVWKDFEVDDIESPEQPQDDQVLLSADEIETKEMPQRVVHEARAEHAATLSEGTIDLERASSTPRGPALDPLEAAEPPSEAVTSTELPRLPPPSGDVHQFPFAVRAERQRKPRGGLDFEATAKASDAAGAATVESNVPSAVISPKQSSTGSLKDAHAALLEATSREAVGRILMQGFRPYFKRRLLLAKRGDQIRGWRADGPGVRPRSLSGMSFLVGEGTPFLSIQSGSRFWLSSYQQDRAFDEIASVLGPIRAPDCMILPLRAGSYIVGFLYGDNEEETVTGQPLNEFLELSDAAGAAFERIIKRLREAGRSGSKATASKSADAAQATPDPWRKAQALPRSGA